MPKYIIPPVPVPDGYKWCSKGDNCTHPNGPVLPATTEYFYMHSCNHKLMAICRACHNAMTRQNAKQWRKENADRSAAYQRDYYGDHHEKVIRYKRDWVERNRDKTRAATKKWRGKNQDKDRLKNAAWRSANHEKVLKNQREWRSNNRDKVRQARQKRRANEKGALGSHTAQDIEMIRQLQHGKCLYCEALLNGEDHLDHFIPLSKGGSNNRENLALACQKCNCSKGDTIAWNWKKWNGVYPVFYDGRLL